MLAKNLAYFAKADSAGIVIGARVQDAAKIQSELFQDKMRLLTDQAKSMGEAAMKAATGVFSAKN